MRPQPHVGLAMMHFSLYEPRNAIISVNDYLTDSEACFSFVLSVKDGVKFQLHTQVPVFLIAWEL